MDSGISLAKVIAAFTLVLGLIGVMAWCLRRFGNAGGMWAGGKEGGKARLRVVEVRFIDPRRKLVLVRRDAVEHLLLLAPDTQLLVESGIQQTSAQASEREEAA